MIINELVNHKTKKAVLASIQLPSVTDDEHEGSLAELGRLVHTLGFHVVGAVSQKRKAPAPGTVLGQGKIKELALFTGGKGFVEGFKARARHREAASDDVGESDDASSYAEDFFEDENDNLFDGEDIPEADVVIFDVEITPTQLRNLEEALGCEVLDRTGVILEIFSRHARSKEARLQVEIAKLGYLAPRLRVSSVGGDRQGGGIGAKGAGETSHELDRRRIRDRISELRAQLETIRGEQNTRRVRRNEAPCVALVGYTNAGKSSLMRALTGSEVLVADKLFATLDTTVRALQPETVPRVLISDTVGFIKKLPHDLVASFRSTLDEAHNASLLLFTVDASDPTFRSQLEVTLAALAEIGADDIPSKLVLNKIDRLDDVSLRLLQRQYPDAIFISTRSPEDIARVRAMILDFFSQEMVSETIDIPYTHSHVVGLVHVRTRVLHMEHGEQGTRFRVLADQEALDQIKESLRSGKRS